MFPFHEGTLHSCTIQCSRSIFPTSNCSSWQSIKNTWKIHQICSQKLLCFQQILKNSSPKFTKHAFDIGKLFFVLKRKMFIETIVKQALDIPVTWQKKDKEIYLPLQHNFIFLFLFFGCKQRYWQCLIKKLNKVYRTYTKGTKR